MPKWLTKALKWAGKALINAGREKIEEIIDEKRSAPSARRKTPKN